MSDDEMTYKRQDGEIEEPSEVPVVTDIESKEREGYHEKEDEEEHEG